MEGVGSGQNESHEMRRNGEKLSWDLRIVDHTLPLPGELLPISWDPTRSQENLISSNYSGKIISINNFSL